MPCSNELERITAPRRGKPTYEVVGMGEIRDRVLLGVLCGLGGGFVKNALSEVLTRNDFAEYGGPARAAGMLLPAHKITSRRGRLVGWIADTTISGMLGVASVYTLSLTGKEKAPLKGALISGAVAWTGLYGVLGTMGATEVQHPQPKTVLSEFLAHTVYGAVVATMATYLGHEDLFNGKIPWSPVGVEAQTSDTFSYAGQDRVQRYQVKRHYIPNPGH
jgi:hypothetical protein